MTEDRATRRLTAILAADVAGYSRLMGADEEGTLAALKAHLKALVDPKITEHRGRIVKTTGDGMLVEFASVVDAVRCAVDIQRGMIERNAEVPQEKRIELRVGVNLGDIIIDAGDIFGDGVNVAARLEGIAEPGGICLSEDAYRQVSGKIEIPMRDLGPQSLKNIARPVRAYSLRPGAVGAPPRVAFSASRSAVLRRKLGWSMAAGLLAIIIISGAGVLWQYRNVGTARMLPLEAAPERLSVVVLPFVNLSGDPAQDYIADAITEELTTKLSRIPSTFVISRNTAFTYKGKATDAKQIGKCLSGIFLHPWNLV